MKEYFICVIAVIFMGGIALTLVPSGFEKQLKLLVGLCTVAIILFPLFSFISKGDEWSYEWQKIFEQGEYESKKYDEIYNYAWVNAEAENADKILKNQIIKEFSLENTDFDVRIITGKISDDFFIERVELIIYASGLYIEPHSVEKYIKEVLDCECEIIYEL